MAKQKAENPQAEALSSFQRPRITDEDCEILSIFRGEDALIMALRNLFLGFDLTETESALIENRLQNDKVREVIRKVILPELDPVIPVGQNMDLWMTTDISEANSETFELIYETKQILIAMIETSLEKLRDLRNPGVDLTPRKDLAFLKARLGYINHTTAVLHDIIMNSHRSRESQEEFFKRIKKNSNK